MLDRLPDLPYEGDAIALMDQVADRVATLTRAKAEAEALVLSHEGQIAKLEAERDHVRHALGERMGESDRLIEALATSRAEAAALRAALDDLTTAGWDSHYGKGLATAYVQSIQAKVNAALRADAGETLALVRVLLREAQEIPHGDANTLEHTFACETDRRGCVFCAAVEPLAARFGG